MIKHRWQRLINHRMAVNHPATMSWRIVETTFLLADLLFLPEILMLLNRLFKPYTRRLTPREIALARSIFGETIDYQKVRVDERSFIGCRQFRFAYVGFHFVNCWGKLSDTHFIHEMVHVWQYQRLGSVYIPRALWAQRTAEGYNYGGIAALEKALERHEAPRAGTAKPGAKHEAEPRASAASAFLSFNYEQQGDIAADYFCLKNGLKPRWCAANKAYLPVFEALMLRTFDPKKIPAMHPTNHQSPINQSPINQSPINQSPINQSLFLRAANGEPTERPPVWLMRQAGRILPQYRALRSKFPDFKAFVKTPEAAAEATLQPVDELGVDAAIIFSDILVVPEAMGLDYEMIEAKGPRFPKIVENQNDVAGLDTGAAAAERLEYVYEALRVAKRALAGYVPLIGFAGAPWTILAYMVEGGGSKTFSKARRMLYVEPDLARALLQKITDTTIFYLKSQVQAGADLVQLFDSWAGELPPAHYRAFAVPYLRQICEALPEVPKTIFAKGAWFALEDLADLPCQVIGLDWNTNPEFAKKITGGSKTLQGNLDPCTLYAEPEVIKNETVAMLRAFGGNHIANLGHGVYPDTPLDGVKAFVEAVKGFRY